MLNHGDEHDDHLGVEVDVVELSLCHLGRTVQEPIGVDVLPPALVVSDQLVDVDIELLPELALKLGIDLLIGAYVEPGDLLLIKHMLFFHLFESLLHKVNFLPLKTPDDPLANK